MIIVVDYGMGNLGSIVNMLSRIGIESKASAEEKDIESADKLILPGVGAFDSGMRSLLAKKLVPILTKKVISEKVPVLGICLGMQMMAKSSEEGSLPGLGWFDAQVSRFKTERVEKKIQIPHMGWNSCTTIKKNFLFEGLDNNSRFYFLHSYHLVCNDKNDIAATTFYGYDFVSVIHKENIFGVQFHPEKSHKFGMKLMENFAKA